MVNPFSSQIKTQTGYQRVLDEDWAKRLIHNFGMAYEIGGLRLSDSIRIAHIGRVDWDPVTRTFPIDLKEEYPMGAGDNYSFDGQHRIHALIKVAEKLSPNGDGAVWDLPIPVTMLFNQPLHYQAWDFYLANIARKNMSAELGDGLLAYLAKTEGFTAIPTLTREVRNRISNASYNNSRSFAARMGTDKESVFYRRLIGGNEEKAKTTKDKKARPDYPVSLRSLGNVIERDILSTINVRLDDRSHDTEAVYMRARSFFNAVGSILIDPKQKKRNRVFTAAGLKLWGILSPDIFRIATHLYMDAPRSQETFEDILKSTLSRMGGDYEGIHIPGWWLPSRPLRLEDGQGDWGSKVEITYTSIHNIAKAFRDELGRG